MPQEAERRIMVSPILNDAEHWRQRATEMRTLAIEASDVKSRAMMVRGADDYESLTLRATPEN
jgi:hypothetical protein